MPFTSPSFGEWQLVQPIDRKTSSPDLTCDNRDASAGFRAVGAGKLRT